MKFHHEEYSVHPNEFPNQLLCVRVKRSWSTDKGQYKTLTPHVWIVVENKEDVKPTIKAYKKKYNTLAGFNIRTRAQMDIYLTCNESVDTLTNLWIISQSSK